MEWNLSDIIETDNIEDLTRKVIKSLDSLENDVIELIKSPTISEFRKIVFTLENIQEELNRIYGYPSLAVEKNNRDEKNIYLTLSALTLIRLKALLVLTPAKMQE